MLGRKLETFWSALWNHRPTWGNAAWVATQTVSKWRNLFLKVQASCLLKMQIYFFMASYQFLSFNFLPTASCQFLLHTHTHTYIYAWKQTCPPRLKNKLGVFILLLSLSPSGLLLLLCPGGVLLFSLGGVASQIAASGAACGALSAVEGGERGEAVTSVS